MEFNIISILGQIRSEFLPSVIFEMPALTGLDLEATKINSLPNQCLSLISELYLAKNFFQGYILQSQENVYNIMITHTLSIYIMCGYIVIFQIINYVFYTRLTSSF